MHDESNFTEQEVRQILDAYSKGASDQEVCMETGFDYDRISQWRAFGDNNQSVIRFRNQPIWNAKKLLAQKVSEDEKVAQWYLSHNKESKTDWSDRVEHTGKDGKDLLPTPIYNGLSSK